MATEKREHDAYMKLLEPYWDTVGGIEDPNEFLEQFAKLEPGIRDLYAIQMCEFEVCNGGFDQFFSNPTGILAPEAVLGFQRVGLIDCAKLLEEAMNVFGSPYPREQEVRSDKLDALNAEFDYSFDEMNKRFYACLNDPNDSGYHSRFRRLANAYASSLAT